jgi:hypothetical protein
MASTRYGFTDAQWQSAVAEATTILIESARSDLGYMTYSDLALRLRSITIGYHDPAMDYLLTQVSTEEHEATRPLLSAVVLHVDDGRPGKGFYDLARELSFDVSDREAFWVSEFRRVTEYWRNHL